MVLETTYTRKFREIAARVIDNKSMALVIGSAGTGKTTAANLYAEQGHARCYFVSGHNLMTPSEYLNALLDKMVQYRDWTLSARYEQALKHYKWQHGITIVDEVDLLSTDVLELIRGLHDASGAPVLFIGSRKFTGRLRKQRLDQLSSRLQFRADFSNLDLSEMRLALPELDSETTKLLHKASRGNLRILSQLLKNIAGLKEVNGIKETTPELIKAAAEDLVLV